VLLRNKNKSYDEQVSSTPSQIIIRNLKSPTDLGRVLQQPAPCLQQREPNKTLCTVCLETAVEELLHKHPVVIKN
jgi:hypothetical protein